MKKSILIKFLFLGVFSVIFNSVNGQTIAPFCGNGTSITEDVYNQNPEARKNRELLEEFTKEYIKNASNKRTTGLKYVVPVVIHIIYSNDNLPTNITDAQVYDAIKNLNNDFNKQNADTASTIPQFKGIAANIEIEFRLAKKDPNGNCTNGITRTLTNLTNIAGENVKAIVGWPTSKYYNVWVVENIASGAGGYAFKPGGAPLPRNEGVVIRSSQFGTIGRANGDDFSSGSFTHETGHWLNLDHTFGGSNSQGVATNCDLSDNVDDTPRTIGGPLGGQTCTLESLTKKKFGALTYSCPDTNGALPNYQNYMDYTGACYTMFTEGQKNRMRAAIAAPIGSRSNLWSEANLIATGINDANYFATTCPPIGSFNSDKREICPSDTVAFNYLATKLPGTKLKWIFPGGILSPKSSDSLTNPRIGYASPGIYDVTVESTNSFGTHSFTLKGAVRVNSELAWYDAHDAGFKESFEQNYLTDNGWYTINVENDFAGWVLAKTAAYDGNNSVGIYNFQTQDGGLTDQLISPPLNFSGSASGTMTFRAALAKSLDIPTPLGSVLLSIKYSTNCGSSWSNLKAYREDSLITAGYVNGPFTPNSPDLWKLHTVPLNGNILGKSNVLFKFEFFSSISANNFFLDDIRFPFARTGIDNLDGTKLGLSIYPNPSEGSAMVKFNLVKSEKVKLMVYDVLGREVDGLKNRLDLNSGEHQFNLNIENKGVYVVKLIVGQNTYTRKLIIN